MTRQITDATYRRRLNQFLETLTEDQVAYLETMTDLVAAAFPLPQRSAPTPEHFRNTIGLTVLATMYLLLNVKAADYRQHWPGSSEPAGDA